MLAGIIAAIVQSAIMQWRVVPLIFEAELYEISETHAPDHANDEVKAAPHKHEKNNQPWEPQSKFERNFYTILATILNSLGFALILAAISTFANIKINLQNGLLWGLAGFLSFNLMPAIGLPPQMPGMIGAELGARQIWWLATVLASIIAILLIVKFPKALTYIIAIIIFILPHIIGAPTPPTMDSDIPAYLATLYAANALFTSLIFWLILGLLYGYFYNRRS